MDWDVALPAARDALREVLDTHGGDGLAALVSPYADARGALPRPEARARTRQPARRSSPAPARLLATRSGRR
ncbi:MAG: hypothetical protein U5K43_00610 [Halofilum sp. (in: g-proteobacteria)]|nr:hypothetical protein [Halofilum sp. (in: g-proteobacteria)]